jgi:hypothetical protein
MIQFDEEANQIRFQHVQDVHNGKTNKIQQPQLTSEIEPIAHSNHKMTTRRFPEQSIELKQSNVNQNIGSVSYQSHHKEMMNQHSDADQIHRPEV